MYIATGNSRHKERLAFPREDSQRALSGARFLPIILPFLSLSLSLSLSRTLQCRAIRGRVSRATMRRHIDPGAKYLDFRASDILSRVAEWTRFVSVSRNLRNSNKSPSIY